MGLENRSFFLSFSRERGFKLAFSRLRRRVSCCEVTAIEDFLQDEADGADHWCMARFPRHLWPLPKASGCGEAAIGLDERSERPVGRGGALSGPQEGLRACGFDRSSVEVKWIEGVFEKESKSSDFPTIILELSKAFAELLCCHKEA